MQTGETLVLQLQLVMRQVPENMAFFQSPINTIIAHTTNTTTQPFHSSQASIQSVLSFQSPQQDIQLFQSLQTFIHFRQADRKKDKKTNRQTGRQAGKWANTT